MSDAIKLRSDAYRYLANREHFRPELVRKLCQKGHDDALVSELLDTLEKEGLFSEQRAAEAYIRSRVTRGYGPLHVEPRLRQKLANKSIVAGVFTRDESFWADVLQQYLLKKHHYGSWEISPELTRHCARRGFTRRHMNMALAMQ